MLTEPADLDQTELKAPLERHWDLPDAQLEYLPVGFGSHHWRAVDRRGAVRFVTVDDLEAGFQAGESPSAAFAALDRAYRTAAALRDEAKLEFVLAPLFDDEGVVIRRLSDRYAITVFPFIVGETSEYGQWTAPDDRRRMGVVLGRLHSATAEIPAGLPRRHDLAVPSRATLLEALGDLDRPWHSGPFAERTRRLLRARARELERRLEAYDELAARVRDGSESWVITHGEPHPGNVIRDRQGGLHLVDWDTALIAPRERDLRLVLDDGLTGWDEYRALTGCDTLNEEAMQLFGEWWDLADVAVFVADFRRPHERTEQTAVAWNNLAGYLSA